MSATAASELKRSAASWRAFWRRHPLPAPRLAWPPRRAALGQLITVSLWAQELIAYDRSRVIVDTSVTAGRPALPTDVGLMRVLRKDAPWTMKSPWPTGSAEWYPDTPVQMVVWLTKNGEGLHELHPRAAGRRKNPLQLGPDRNTRRRLSR